MEDSQKTDCIKFWLCSGLLSDLRNVSSLYLLHIFFYVCTRFAKAGEDKIYARSTNPYSKSQLGCFAGFVSFLQRGSKLRNRGLEQKKIKFYI